MNALLSDPKLYAARDHFVLCCHASRTHSNLAASALNAYGDHGPLISGCVREHFPADVKDELRSWAKEVGKQSDLAYAAKPKRIRRATMIKLGRAVATRDGSGFYGPQPDRQS